MSLRLFVVTILAAQMVCSMACSFASEPAHELKATGHRYSVKWHPGNYILLPYDIPAEGFQHVLVAISESPDLRGIQKRYTWRSLEPREGLYDFTEIVKDLEASSEKGKRLVIQIQAKSFKPGAIYVPPYIVDSSYDGGIIEFRRGGFAPKLWNSRVLERLNALYLALGAALDKHPALEAVTIPETALGKFKEKGKQKDRDAYLEALLLSARQLRESFPTTVVIQYLNWPLKAVDEFSRRAVRMSLGIGGPDTFPYASKLNSGAYRIFPGLAGLVPIGIAVQNPNFNFKYPGGPYDPTSIYEIYTFARDKLHANYIFWLYVKSNDNYFFELRELLAKEGHKGSLQPPGGLKNDCPEVFLSCNK